MRTSDLGHTAPVKHAPGSRARLAVRLVTLKKGKRSPFHILPSRYVSDNTNIFFQETNRFPRACLLLSQACHSFFVLTNEYPFEVFGHGNQDC